MTKYDKPFSADSQRNILAESKTFMNWCVRPGSGCRRTPSRAIKVEGKRRHRKPQLRVDEARSGPTGHWNWGGGRSGAVAALVAYLMGFRASEVVKRVVRDLDDEGKILVIENAKTEAGNRGVEVPKVLRPLLKNLAAGKGPTERLFGNHWRDWVRKSVGRICREVGVPVVCAHSMRGLHSLCGHGRAASRRRRWPVPWGTSQQERRWMSYATKEAVEAGRQRRVAERMLSVAPRAQIRQEYRSAIVPQRHWRRLAAPKNPVISWS